ncbi:hypothetical protein KEN51_CDS0350 [Pseudomonas phage vB_Pae10145-KEN51]|uniref:Uncharacterized protein n=5 Tax=Viruses TaxID=10239 RepID=I7CDR4_9CAUD|nr:hypothetical protein [Pseudomonas aeruginosa]YP_009617600.1 hypothetical protein FDI90_gp312 [Pseudomonas phage PA7]YP_009619825.1 hypothetical protein FDJ06_gp285 [Pseudomonas phage SL2]ANM44851.1 hypothetical protein KTN4_093 [Pseudomonas phage KTN4]QGK90086.1 hypothetical protein [Pseudomonas phage vB_PA32_GUMS]QJB22729.1 hypothetical protein fnug_86 [Pseudomonas phage fnug]QOV07943.1 hypothetical protein [Pseudomonas phage vB_PaeM_kmuB]QYV99103.1 hypothetical protein [Pseudomonas phag
MAFTLLANQPDSGESVYYEPGFRLIIETHLNILRNVRSTRIQIPPELYYQFEGNFYGYMAERRVNPDMWWIQMRVNGLVSPYDFGKVLRDPSANDYTSYLIIPNNDMIQHLVSLYQTKKF